MAEESMKMCIRVSLVPSLVSRRVVNFAAGFLYRGLQIVSQFPL